MDDVSWHFQCHPLRGGEKSPKTDFVSIGWNRSINRSSVGVRVVLLLDGFGLLRR